MEIKVLALLAAGLLAGPIAAKADESVTYDFTGVVTSETGNAGVIGSTITGAFTFTYDNATDTLTGTLGANSPWSIGASGIPYTPYVSAFSMATGRYTTLPLPPMDLDGGSSVVWSSTGLSASELARAYPSESFLEILGHTPSPFNPSGDPVNLLSKGVTAIAGYSVGGIGDTFTVTRLTLAAPEIDPWSAVSGLTLLLGSVVLLRGHRQSESRRRV